MANRAPAGRDRANGRAALGYARPSASAPSGPPESPLPDSDPSARPASARPPWLLAAGAAIGLGLATWGLLEERREARTLPPEVAARIGDRSIRVVDYQRVLAGVENDLRNPVDAKLRRRVLERMVDEELLVQRALDLGLAVADRRVRGELTSGLIDSIVSEVDADPPSERDVARHYEENVEFFTRPGRLRARTLFFSTRRDGDPGATPAAERCARAAERLGAGEDPGRVAAELADRQVSPLPDVLLPPSKVRDYVGPGLLERIESLEVGAWSEPIQSPAGLHLALLIEREPPIVPSQAEVEDLVRQDLRRRRGDEALRRYLEELREQTPVLVNESLFASDASDAGPDPLPPDGAAASAQR